MRLVPRSLFGRLVLVLAAGLVTAQLASLSLHLHERDELIAQATGRQIAQRIADIVKLLDTLDSAERRRIVRVFSAPPVVMSLDQPPLATRNDANDGGTRAAFFGAMLSRLLADGRPVAVRFAETEAAPFAPGAMGAMKGAMKGAAGYGDGPPPWAGMRRGAQPRFSFVAQTRLRDGTLVTFNAYPPAGTESWPYRLLASVALLLAAVIVLSWVAVRWATRPLNALADAADELGRDIHRPPLPEAGPEEVSRAARAFNTMQARLAGYLRDRTRVLAAMSHDLKTPVTRLRLRAELLADPQLRAKFTKDLDEMESMVGATLDFLRGQESGEAVQPVDVMALLESIQADMAEIGGQIDVEGALLEPYPGRPQALKRCLRNLLENAVKYGESARVLVDDTEARLEIRIQDKGPGLAPAELGKVFEPFYRVEGSRSRETGGTGLGLTIARSVAVAHGGSLELSNRAEGGLEAIIILPRRGSETAGRTNG